MVRRALHLIPQILRHLLFQIGTTGWELSYLLCQKHPPDLLANGVNMLICWEQPPMEPAKVGRPGIVQLKWQGSWLLGDVLVEVHKR